MAKLVSAFILGLVLVTQSATAQNKTSRPAASGFSFDVYGDSRSMMYLPYNKDQEAEARKLMVDMFALVLPQKVADEVVQKNVKLIYDPSTNELVQMVIYGDEPSQVDHPNPFAHLELGRGEYAPLLLPQSQLVKSRFQ